MVRERKKKIGGAIDSSIGVKETKAMVLRDKGGGGYDRGKEIESVWGRVSLTSPSGAMREIKKFSERKNLFTEERDDKLQSFTLFVGRQNSDKNNREFKRK